VIFGIKGFAVAAVFTAGNIFSQDLNENYAKYIDTIDLRRHLSVLASDALEGRETGKAGQHKAAAYIKEQFEAMGCAPVKGAGNYFQSFNLLEKIKSGTISWGKQTLSYPQDFGFNGLYQPFSFSLREAIYMRGEDLMNIKSDVSDNYLLVEIDNYTAFNESHIAGLKAKGIIFLLRNYDARYFTEYKSEGLSLIRENIKVPYLFVNKKSAEELFSGLNVGTNKVSVKVKLNPAPVYVPTENVLAFVEGSDPILKNEVIVISAHYDHIGIKNGKIHNGADDNGSGTSGMLEIAQAFCKAQKDGKQPKRSVLFIALTGEEMGLLGSSYYTDNPLIPLKNTITDLNIDMIGRVTKPSEEDAFSVFVIGSNMLSDDLHFKQAFANATYTRLDLDYTYNDLNHPMKLYFRSDHYNFAKNNIPSIFYFGGFHDDYHQSTDDIEHINFEKIRQVSTLVFHTAWLLGNAESRPEVNH